MPRKRKGFYDDLKLSSGGWKVEEIEKNFKCREKNDIKVGYDPKTRVFCEGKLETRGENGEKHL